LPVQLREKEVSFEIMIFTTETYCLWEKAWPGHSLEEIDAIIAPFSCSQMSQDYTQSIERKKKYTNRLFYKFCDGKTTTEGKESYAIANLKRDVLYLANPREFNDPNEISFAFDMENFLAQRYSYSRRYDPQGLILGLFQMTLGSFGYPITPEAISTLKTFFQKRPSIVSKGDAMFRAANEIKAIMADDGNEVLFYHFLTHQLTFDDFIAFSSLFANDKRLRGWAEAFDIPRDTNKNIILNKLFVHFETFSFRTDDAKTALLEACEMANYPKTQQVLNAYDSFKAYRIEIVGKWEKECVSSVGIASLSENYDNPLMWAHYARQYQGFCLEYDLSNPLSGNEKDIAYARSHIVPVLYSSKKPLLSFDEKDLSPRMKLKNTIAILAGKDKCWSYENEWRIISNGQERSRELIVRPKSILLGTNISDKLKKTLKEIAQNKQIPVFTTYLDPQNYCIHKSAGSIL
jgi:hypothetical protein